MERHFGRFVWDDAKRRRNLRTHGVDFRDVAKACDAVRTKGGTVTREAGPVKGGTTVIAFVADPDGYKIEFIERKARA